MMMNVHRLVRKWCAHIFKAAKATCSDCMQDYRQLAMLNDVHNILYDAARSAVRSNSLTPGKFCISVYSQNQHQPIIVPQQHLQRWSTFMHKKTCKHFRRAKEIYSIIWIKICKDIKVKDWAGKQCKEIRRLRASLLKMPNVPMGDAACLCKTELTISQDFSK